MKGKRIKERKIRSQWKKIIEKRKIGSGQRDKKKRGVKGRKIEIKIKEE